MSSTPSYDDLFTSLTKVINNVADENSESNPEHAKKLFFKYIKSSLSVFLNIAMAYSIIERYKTYYDNLKIDKYKPDVLTMEMTLGKFIHGLWPENSNGLSGEEADYLRKCLKCIPLKHIKPEKIIEKSEFLNAEFGDERDKELLNKKTVEIFSVFLITLLQNSRDKYSEPANFLRELLTVDET